MHLQYSSVCKFCSKNYIRTGKKCIENFEGDKWLEARVPNNLRAISVSKLNFIIKVVFEGLNDHSHMSYVSISNQKIFLCTMSS